MERFNYDRLDPEMIRVGRFCLWRLVPINGKLRKIPYQVNGQEAHTDKMDSEFVCYAEALDAYHRNKMFDGIGIGITSGVCCCDVDHSYTDGKLSEKALWVIQTLGGGYTEVSQSGNGVHIFFKVPDGFVFDAVKYKQQPGDVELYVAPTRRFIALTGKRLEVTT